MLATWHLHLARTGGDSWSVPSRDGCVSSVGPRGKWHGDRAWYTPPTSTHSCGQTVYWEAGAPHVKVHFVIVIGHLIFLKVTPAILVLFCVRQWLWCLRVWKALVDRATSRILGCPDCFVMHRWGQYCTTEGMKLRKKVLSGFQFMLNKTIAVK